MDRSREIVKNVVLPFILFLTLISLSKCDSIMTVIEGEIAKLEFPYPCDSEIITIQNANRAPFYSSTDSNNLHLPNYEIPRFSVEAKNCSVQVEINPVMKDDEATYICIAYKDGVIPELIRFRLNVDYPPGKVSCVPTGKVHVRVGDWVLLKCEMSVGSFPWEIICYQDAKRLPPQNELYPNGKILKQTIWATEEHPVFCCSSVPDQPTDICECNDFAWDPSYTESVLHPCPSTTPRLLTTMKDQKGENSTDYPFPNTVSLLSSIRTPKKGHLSPWFLGFIITIAALVACLVACLIFTIRLWCKVNLLVNNPDSTEKKDECSETCEMRSKVRDYVCAPKISDEGFGWVDIQNKAQKEPLLGRKSFAGFQRTSLGYFQHMPTGVYRL